MKLNKTIAGLAIAVIAGGTVTTSVSAKKMSDLKIYINPGHGGYTSNDRPIRIYPYAQNDSNGYWESKSNLYKGLHMYHILKDLGATPMLSRTKNTEDDDRSLSGIAAEANSFGADLFFSIHSNAGEDVNYPIMLYRENQIGVPRYPENITLSNILFDNLISNQLPVWTRTSRYVEGDLTFYQNMWQGGLGVLRTLYVVGLLSEGGMHEHRPEAHRLMNDDYWYLEAWHFVRAIMEFENTEDRFTTGNVAGIVHDNHNLRELYMPVSFHNYGRDRLATLNKATVELLDEAGNVVQSKVTDNDNNGVFVFREVKPGKYTVRSSHPDYYTETTPVTVTANEVTYQDMPLTLKRPYSLEITSFSPDVKEGESVSCASTINFTFNTDVDTEAFERAFSINPPVDGYFVYSDSYRKASFVPNLSLDASVTYTVNVTTDAKTPDTYFDKPNLQEPLQFSFFTRGRSRLELIDQFPADGGRIHYASPSLEFRFDKSIDYSKIYDQVSVTDASGKALQINKRSSKYNQLSNDYGNAVLAIQGNLTPGETYTVKVSGELRDRESLPMANDVVSKFTAFDATVEGGADEAQMIQDFEDETPFAYNPEKTKGITTTTPTAIKSTAAKLFGKASGKFGYQFSDNHGGEIVWTYNGTPVQFNPGDKIGMYINGDFNNHELWVGVASGANTKYTKLTDLDFLGWQYREVALENLDPEFCPFLLSEIKLIQKDSPITQKGSFGVDNMMFRAENGVSDITVDGQTVVVAATNGTIAVSGTPENAAVKVIAIDGRTVATATGNASVAVTPGLYLVTVNDVTVKVSVN